MPEPEKERFHVLLIPIQEGDVAMHGTMPPRRPTESPSDYRARISTAITQFLFQAV